MVKNITLVRSCLAAAMAVPLAAAIPAFAQTSAQNADTQNVPGPMTAQDLVTMPRVGAPSVSPDGETVLFRVTNTDAESFKRTATYYLQSLSETSAPPVSLTMPEGAGSPVIGPDGMLYFLAPGPADDTLADFSQLWRAKLTADGALGEADQLSTALWDIGGFSLSPDGARVVLYGDLPRVCPDFSCHSVAFDQNAGPQLGTGRLYDDDIGFVRHWDAWEVAGERSRAIAYMLADDGLSDPVPLDGAAAENALDGDTPTKPFGGGEDIAWAVDSRSVFFVAREGGREEPGSTDLDIYQTKVAPGAVPANLTDANEATDALPAPSPDGKWLAYAAMARPGYESDRMVIHLRDLTSGKTRALTQNYDRSFHSLSWTPDSRWIVATAQDVLDTPAFRIDPASGKVEKLDLMPGNEAHLGNVLPLADNRILFTRDSIAAPAEIYLSENWQVASQITGAATSRVAALAPVQTQRFSFAGAGDDTVWGQITKPSGLDGTLPVILYIHGGPQGSFNDGWSSRWNPRVLASQGYAVVSVDFHGSTGYGQEFTDAINRDWGGKPLEDLQKGLAAALAQDSQIDGTRACAMGASYGGYMVNWIAGNWADRFDCLIQHDGLFDMRMFYYTTEELWFPRWDFGGSYAEQAELYERWNPVNYVKNWRTPMLVVAGEQDFRIPYTQGLASFTALQEQDVEAELLVFPDENHWVLGAENSLLWHQTVFTWLDRWLGEDTQGNAAE